MRVICAVLLMSAGLGLVGACPASASPANGVALAGASQRTDIVIDVAGGCGRWHHRDHRGHCVHD
jgi:hypothetical protein